MAGKQEIELFISDDGDLKVHIKGMKGPGCLKVLEALTSEIGSEKERTLTGEYYASAKNTNTTFAKLKK